MRKLQIKMVATISTKVGNKWREDAQETRFITLDEYNLIVGAKKYSTNLGGYERHYKSSYTCEGHVVTRIISIKPNKDIKIDRVFKFSYEKDC